MQLEILKSKIHGLTITEANVKYVGSLTLDEDLMLAAGVVEYEKIQVVNINNGERIETYLIKGVKGSGVCCLNGPAARKGVVGDIVILLSYGFVKISDVATWVPIKVFPIAGNKLDHSGMD